MTKNLQFYKSSLWLQDSLRFGQHGLDGKLVICKPFVKSCFLDKPFTFKCLLVFTGDFGIFILKLLKL